MFSSVRPRFALSSLIESRPPAHLPPDLRMQSSLPGPLEDALVRPLSFHPHDAVDDIAI
jgi:hypothetical protein